MLGQEIAERRMLLQKCRIADRLGILRQCQLQVGPFIEHRLELRDLGVAQGRVRLAEQGPIKKIARIMLQPLDDLRICGQKVAQFRMFLQVTAVPGQRRIQPQIILQQRMVVEKTVKLPQRPGPGQSSPATARS